MNELDHLVKTIKKQLKNQGMTYAELAQKLRLSEPSVKRLMSAQRMTVDRLAEIAKALGYTLAELIREATELEPKISILTEKQELEVVSDIQLLIVAVCALNHWTLDDIAHYYKMTKAQCIKHLLKLDELRLIDLLPNNRIRIIVARDFDWLPEGPIRLNFKRRGMPEFLNHRFLGKNEAMTFVHGMFSEQAMSQLQTDLRQLQKKFAQLHEESLITDLADRKGCGLLFAFRAWEPDDFKTWRKMP